MISFGEAALTCLVMFTVVGRKDLPRCARALAATFLCAVTGSRIQRDAWLVAWRDSSVRAGRYSTDSPSPQSSTRCLLLTAGRRQC